MPSPGVESARGETILAVEDDAALRKLFRRILERGGYTVLQAANGKEALRVIEQQDGRIDLVISDVMMPVMSGTEMAQRLSERYPLMKILFTSGYAQEDIVRHDVQSPGTSFLQKPIAPDVLLRAVRDILNSDS